MSIQITALALDFLSQKYLNDLKKESFNRSKPSKAILDALKHSTSLNKELQIQIQSLTAQLSSVCQQNEFMKEMIQNLNQAIQILKISKQEKNKKLCQLQAQYITKIEFLTNQNSLLKKQIQLLKIKKINGSESSFQSQMERLQTPQMDKKPSAVISEIQNNKKHNYESSLCDSIPFQQSIKFKKYLNYDSGTQNNQQTRPNSKLKLQFYESQEIKTPKIKYLDQQCDQLAPIVTFKRESKVSKDFNEFIEQMSPCQRNIPSIQSITPKILEITSQQQIYIDDEYKRVETPTLPKCFFNPGSQKKLTNDSKFKVFEEQLTTSIQGSYKPVTRNSDITFLNLETKKSIEEGIQKSSKSKIRFYDLSKNQKIQERDETLMDYLEVAHDNQAILQNLSGVDLHGLMGDIQICPFENQEDEIVDQNDIHENQKQNNSSDSKEMFYKTQDFTHRKGNSKINVQLKSQRSASDFYPNDKIKTIIDYLKEPSESSKMPSIENQLPSVSSHTLSQQNRNRVPQKRIGYGRNDKVKVAIHEPYKYMSIAESYKTIEFNKSYKQLKQNQDKSRKNIDRINEIDKSNESSYLTKSRGFQSNSKSSGSKSMTNSKIMLYNSVRRNKKNKSLSPLSVQNRRNQDKVQEQINKSNSSQKNGKSYSLIQSIRSRKHDPSGVNNRSVIVPDQCNNQDSDIMPNATVILNCSTFRKNFQDTPMTQSTHPAVTFKQVNFQNSDKYQ